MHRFAELVLRSAVERNGRLSLDLERDGQHRAGRFAMPVAAGPAVLSKIDV
jgi:hypothetical protein